MDLLLNGIAILFLILPYRSSAVTYKDFDLLTDKVHKILTSSSESLDPKAATELSDQLLTMAPEFEKHWNYGNALHYAHLVLGRVHLAKGEMDESKKQLRLGGETPGSPQLNTFGPNMTLAKELLEHGEKKAVLDYFDSCLKFWKSKRAGTFVSEWASDINSGRPPKFGAHLKY